MVAAVITSVLVRASERARSNGVLAAICAGRVEHNNAITNKSMILPAWLCRFGHIRQQSKKQRENHQHPVPVMVERPTVGSLHMCDQLGTISSRSHKIMTPTL